MKTTDLKKGDAVRITTEFVWSRSGSGEYHTRAKSKEAFVVSRVNEKSVTLLPKAIGARAVVSTDHDIYGSKTKGWTDHEHASDTTFRLSHARNLATEVEVFDNAYAAHKSVARTEKLTPEYLGEIAADRTHLTEQQVADIRAFAGAPPFGAEDDEFWPHQEAFRAEVDACCRTLGVGYNLKEDEAYFLVEPLVHTSVVFGKITDRDLLVAKFRMNALESRGDGKLLSEPTELIRLNYKRRVTRKTPQVKVNMTDGTGTSFTHRLIQLLGEGYSVGLVPEGYGFRLTVTHLARRKEATVVLPMDHLREEKLLKYEAVLVTAIEEMSEPNMPVVTAPPFTSTVAHA